MSAARWVLGALLVGATSLQAQARVTGIVRDSAGRPVAGAEVSVQGTTKKTLTDGAGTFQIAGIPSGTYAVGVRKVGFVAASTIRRLYDGNNQLADMVLVATTVQLDTVVSNEQAILREYPLLREFEENRRVGLGQFVTRAQFEKQRGGFLSPIVSQMRGLVVVRSMSSANKLWLANKYIPQLGRCTELEDREGAITPPKADCDYCYPDVYIDRHKISSPRRAVNVGQFHPDMLQAMEVYLGAAETPAHLASGATGCGVIVFHSRIPDNKPRIIAARQDVPTRSRVYANVSASAGAPGRSCQNCGAGSAFDAMAGYTWRDRWVIGGRYGQWTGGRDQRIQLAQALVEWYPRPDPGRFKWFMNAGAGGMSVRLNSLPSDRESDVYKANLLPSLVLGSGIDIAVVNRFIVSPFASYARNIGGNVDQTHCRATVLNDGTPTTVCFPVSNVKVFSLLQLGTRVGWR